jgi:hypothetical protein
MIHEACSVDAGKKLVRTHGMQPPESDNGQEDSERISILQEGDKYEADTTAP